MDMFIAGHEIQISNPDKVLWKEANITKRQYIQYLLSVADYLIPYTTDKMLMWWLYPAGFGRSKVEKRSLPKNAPEWMPAVFYKKKQRVLLNNKPALAWIANQEALELHVPFDTYQQTDYPTELVFDLDPAGQDDFELALEIALRTKEVLDSIGLFCVAKTSGKSGMHIHVPIDPDYRFEETRKVNRFIANYMAEKYASLITLDRVVARRGNKLYFDYLQLWKGRTMAVPYSVRATPEATVSTPVEWSEVQKGFRPEDFTILNMEQRLREKGDLFRPMTTEKQAQRLDEILRFIESHKM
ncbi:DNA polymerase domain-containing protein [Brevibacillus humidisoli]|uniref:DNA polymerase domain-containing protein n=1 Tax=Brevibacillus humidisoli TaxID=2895522 RepID=UPI001E3DB2A8|nr:DNA polymerase domain-containing protein [Brevibacillus humidisoli]UFJ40722.1 DNA polymerase domain-containing protein [Brevibacillus humidisoli]